MVKGNILIVDDNQSILGALEILLSPEFQVVSTLSNPEQIPSELKRKDYNLILLDMNFKAGVNTGNEGIYWLNRIKEIDPQVSVVMITAYGDVELAIKALKSGATDFVLKPWDNEKLLATLNSAIELNLSKKEVTRLKEKTRELKQEINRNPNHIIGSSPKLMQVLNMVRKVAKTDANVLITGENGTGKELIAREIHRLSVRNGEIMVNVDMGAITETLFESELFGHVKGSFTDANDNRAGKFEMADRGSLFLDEIGNLSYHLQAKILAAIQNREVYRVGSNRPIPVDIRLICATNKNLEQLVQEGVFREDLLYRINTIQIEVPPLRERGDDVLILANFFLKKYAARYNKTNLRINQQASQKLLNYPWPGNVRELQHTIEKAVILGEGSVLNAESFFMKPIVVPTKGINTPLTLSEMEQQLINQAIQQHHGNLSAVAEQLGITRQTLYNKLKKMGQ
ncbi:MAG: sigma-54-dependent transcriptional regulator [Bacteroidales bacterium]